MYKKEYKTSARQKFNTGKDIYLFPCKIRATVGNPVVINKENARGASFDELVNVFESQYCNSKVGTYASYFTLR